MTIPVRPAGRSFLTDLASAGAGFATGLREEKERQRQVALEEAMRQFQVEMANRQFGLQQRGVDLEEQGLGLQGELRDIQRAQLEQGRTEADARLKLQRDELAQAKELAYAEMANRVRVAEIQARSAMARGNRDDALAFLNGITMDVSRQLDDVRNDIRGMESTMPHLLRYRIEPTRARTQTSQKAQSGDKSAADQLAAFDRYDRLMEMQRELKRQQSHYSKFRQNVGGALDIPPPPDSPDNDTDATSWAQLSPQQQLQRQELLAELIKSTMAAKGREPDYTDFVEFGVPFDVIEKARESAGVLAPSAPDLSTGAPAQPQYAPKPLIGQPLPKGAPATMGGPHAPPIPQPTQPSVPPSAVLPQLPPGLQPPSFLNNQMPKSPEATALDQARMAYSQGRPLNLILAGIADPRIRRMIADSLAKHRIQP